MTLKNRKSLFLLTTARRGLHGGLLKDDQGHDGIEVGPGVASAMARMNSDDTRKAEPEQKPDEGKGNQPQDGGNADDSGDDGDEGNQPQDDGEGDGDDGNEDDGGDARGKRGTAEYIRELKRERREARERMAAQEAKIEQLMQIVEKGVLPSNQDGGNSQATREAPDVNDAGKYPLGVLDERYIQDQIEWVAEQKVAAKLDGERRTEMARREAAESETRAAKLREQLDSLTESGSKLFDDYDDIVDSGMRGDWKLTETTFVAAAKREHGAEILYNLAKNPREAARVAALPVDEQAEYVIEKNREIAEKRKARVKPQAGSPPQNTPRGRNSSSPIRPDTDDLDDFRKIFYKK